MLLLIELDYQAITILSNLLTSGTISQGPVFIPPPFHLSFILTLSLHPRFTIHALTSEKLRVSIAATTYLLSLLTIVGPVSGGFSQAYAFNNHAYMRGGRKKINQTHTDSSEESETEPVESDLAQTQGFFNRSDDLWSALGWAFTCSVLHPKRWESWSSWCSHIITLLEQDWQLHEKEGSKDDKWTRKTLVAQYISKCTNTKVKRIVRAVFAQGTSPEFTEIWKDETRLKRKKTSYATQRAKLDIEAGQLGDYAAQSSDDEETISGGEEPSPVSTHLSTLGNSEAITFRSRLLALLSSLALADPEYFTPLVSLYTTFLTHLRPLSLPTFHSFVNPQSLATFTPEAKSGLIQFLARSFLEHSAPPCSMDELNWPIIEKYYAPWASTGQTGLSTVSDNGKLGVCIELLVSLARTKLGFTPLLDVSIAQATGRSAAKYDGLWASIERGCTKRQARAGHNARRAKKGEAGAEFDFETARDFEVAFLGGARFRLALLLGMNI